MNIYIVVAVLATALSSTYLYFVVKLIKGEFTHEYHEFYIDLRKTRKMQWILSSIFTAMIILMSLSLMIKLKVRFYDFYREYGCFLWAIFTIQAISMIIKTTIEVLLN